MSGSDISWAICKSALRSRQTDTAPHHSVFYRLPPGSMWLKLCLQKSVVIFSLLNAKHIFFFNTAVTKYHSPVVWTWCNTVILCGVQPWGIIDDTPQQLWMVVICSIRWWQCGTVISGADRTWLQLPRQRVPNLRHHWVMQQLKHSLLSSDLLPLILHIVWPLLY